MSLPKRKKESSPKHESWIRTLDCFVCYKPSQSMLAHIRQGFLTMSRKPGSDRTVPLCGECHQTGPGAQHTMSEEKYWLQNGYPNIIAGARYLFEHTGEIEALDAARRIAREVSQ